MGSSQTNIMGNYLKYKDKTLSFYNALLTDTESKSAVILLQTLKDVESNHKKETRSNKKIKKADIKAAFSEILSLTPIDELPHLSLVFDDVITVKKKLLESHINELRESPNFEEMKNTVDQIKVVEDHICNTLKEERKRLHL